MRYYIIAGEASGDLHGSRLTRELIARDPEAQVRAWGGDRMQKEGAEIVRHIRDLAFMGFLEVMTHLKTIRHNLEFCKQDLREYRPDVLILIDYPGFNLRMAGYAQKWGIKVFYYISPKIWAWKKRRIRKIRAWVDKMFVIFPFEKDYYKQLEYPVEFYGNPVVDAVHEFTGESMNPEAFRKEYGLDERPLIALLAGSRMQEIRYNLPHMSRMSRRFPQYQFVIAGLAEIPDSYYHKYTSGEEVVLIKDKTYEILNQAEAALVTSGTATLETAFFEVPQVVCYRANPVSVFLGRMLVHLSWISLVNLNMNKEVVRELIQHDMTPENLYRELKAILPGGTGHQRQISDYRQLQEVMGPPGCSARVGERIIQLLNDKRRRK